MLENYGEAWTEVEVKQLLLLKEDKKTSEQIAKALGRTKASIDYKYHQIKHKLGEKSRTWTHEETEMLTLLAETLPVSLLFIRYNEMALKKGYKKRTLASVKRKLSELGQSLKPSSGWYGIPAISIGLGFSRERIYGWIQSGLKHHAEGKNYFYVRNDHLVAYILSHPNCLNGISDDGLCWFIALLNEEKEMRGYLGRPEYDRALSA